MWAASKKEAKAIHTTQCAMGVSPETSIQQAGPNAAIVRARLPSPPPLSPRTSRCLGGQTPCHPTACHPSTLVCCARHDVLEKSTNDDVVEPTNTLQADLKLGKEEEKEEQKHPESVAKKSVGQEAEAMVEMSRHPTTPEEASIPLPPIRHEQKQ